MFDSWVGRSTGEGSGNPLQYSCLENTMDGGAWWATVHEVARAGHDLATKPPPSFVIGEALVNRAGVTIQILSGICRKTLVRLE